MRSTTRIMNSTRLGRPGAATALCPVSAAFAALLSLVLSACIGELDTASSVHDLRVLALRADPPECYLGRDEPKFRLTALVADVEDGLLVDAPRHYRVSTCPAPEDSRCEGLDGEIVLGEGSFSGEEFAIEFAFTEAHAPLLEAALRADTYLGFGGLPVLLSVKVWRGDSVEYAAKRLVLQLPGLSIEGEPANDNPPAPRLVVDGAPLAEGEVIEIAGRELSIDVTPEAREAKPSYRVPTFSGGALTLNESWTYAWLTTRGAYAPETTGGLNPVSQADLSAETTLELDASDAPGDFTSWVVLRDGRGGVSWTRFSGRFVEVSPEEGAAP
ncbi:MAG: hypothetical protein IKC51_08915 [Myxococcaceae bacterium]|nr:hypothetical protein [Myxococcaceae bacterium]